MMTTSTMSRFGRWSFRVDGDVDVAALDLWLGELADKRTHRCFA